MDAVVAFAFSAAQFCKLMAAPTGWVLEVCACLGPLCTPGAVCPWEVTYGVTPVFKKMPSIVYVLFLGVPEDHWLPRARGIKYSTASTQGSRRQARAFSPPS